MIVAMFRLYLLHLPCSDCFLFFQFFLFIHTINQLFTWHFFRYISCFSLSFFFIFTGPAIFIQHVTIVCHIAFYFLLCVSRYLYYFIQYFSNKIIWWKRSAVVCCCIVILPSTEEIHTYFFWKCLLYWVRVVYDERICV